MMPLLNPGVFIDMGDFIADGKVGNEPSSDDSDGNDDDGNDDNDDDNDDMMMMVTFITRMR